MPRTLCAITSCGNRTDNVKNARPLSGYVDELKALEIPFDSDGSYLCCSCWNSVGRGQKPRCCTISSPFCPRRPHVTLS